jgi:hypothetical protein
MNRRELFAGMGGLGLAGMFGGGAFARDDLRGQARDAWIYGLPLIEMATTRGRHMAAGAPLNRFVGGRSLATHESRQVTTPNNDTLYLSAWVDLSEGPVILTVPALGTRYWSVAVMDMFTNNNAVLGSRTVGGKGGVFALVGPDHGDPWPKDVVRDETPRPVRVATNQAWVLARVLVDGPEEVAAVQALLRGFALKGGATKAYGPYAGRAAPGDEYFGGVQRLLYENRPPATDLEILRRCDFFLNALPPPRMVLSPSATAQQAEQIEGGIADAGKLIQGGWGRQAGVQGWTYPRPNLGDYGQDYLYRAAIALGGLGALPPAEAVYLRPDGEADGLFKSDKTWRLSLPADVPVDGFWSLSMYEATADGQFFFTDNPLGRYAIGDRTKGLKRRADGGVDLWIGRTDPGGERTANWLPAPKAGPWTVTWRGYLGRPALLTGAWRMPALVAI